MEYKPYPFQSYCIQRLIEDDAVALFISPGLGKTSITLTALNELRYRRFTIGKTLVIAPKKVAETVWTAEAAKWDHLQLLRFSLVLGTAKQRERALYAPADVYVINRDNVAWLVDYFKHAWPYDVVVLDESTSFKNRSSKRFRKLAAVRPRVKRVIELTGTPTSQGLIDLWAQIYLLDGGERLGKTLGQFRTRYFDPDKRSREVIYTYKPKFGAEEAIKKLLSDICISMKAEDYITLPELIYDDIPVKLDAKAQKEYDRLEREALLRVDETVITAANAAVVTGKLLQYANGAVYDETHGVHEMHDCKIDAFRELIEALGGEHALVFYAFRHDCDRLLRALGEDKGLRYRQLQTPQDAEDWNAGKVDVLLAHPASCAYGLNLQHGGHHVIWFGLSWSLELTQQANDRLYRQGQERPVIVHRLIVQGTRDEDVVAAIASKADVQESLMQSLKARIDKIKRKGA